jgi:hypothetical protein
MRIRAGQARPKFRKQVKFGNDHVVIQCQPTLLVVAVVTVAVTFAQSHTVRADATVAGRL